jgi:hypothetical protein
MVNPSLLKIILSNEDGVNLLSPPLFPRMPILGSVSAKKYQAI